MYYSCVSDKNYDFKERKMEINTRVKHSFHRTIIKSIVNFMYFLLIRRAAFEQAVEHRNHDLALLFSVSLFHI